MAHLVLPRSSKLIVDGKKIKSMDMHFEKYPALYHPNLQDWVYQFSAKIPGQNIHLIYKNGKTTLATKGLSYGLFGEISDLPEFWWDYAQVNFSDGSTKPPKEL